MRNSVTSSQLTDREGELLRKCLADEQQRERIRSSLYGLDEGLATLRETIANLRKMTWFVEDAQVDVDRSGWGRSIEYKAVLALVDALSSAGLGEPAEELCRRVEHTIERYRMILETAARMHIVTDGSDEKDDQA